MSVTQLSDVIVPEVFHNYSSVDTTEKTAIFKSGVMRMDSEINLAGGGRTINVPFWQDLDNSESNTGSDNPNHVITPRNLTGSKDICRRQVRTQAWSTMDLAGLLAGSDPMARIQNRANAYWERDFQGIMVKTLTGLFADNVANDSSDMVNEIGNDSAAAVTDAELISANAVIDTAYTMGDNADVLKVLIVHSTVKKRLKKLNLIDFIPDARGEIMFDRYLGYRIIEDDGVRTETGTNRTKYWSYLLGPDCFGWTEEPVAKPVAVTREELQGGGTGAEILTQRRQFVMHPYGIKFTDASVGGEFPTNAELAAAVNWDRVYSERKQIPIAALVTNG